MKDFILKYWLETIFAGLITALTFAYKRQADKFKKREKDNLSMKNGLKALLRDRIVQMYNVCVDRGYYCPIYMLENAESAYEAYHDLGGNGTITQLMKELREMKHSRAE